MKILMVSPVGAFFSGAEVAISHLMAYLVEQGHEVYNIIPDNGPNKDQAYLEFMASHGITLFEIPSQRWWWSEAHPIRDVEKDGVFAYQHQNIAQVREIIREKNIDLVISNTVNVFQGALAAAAENCLHYYIIHEFPFGEFGYYQEKISLIETLSDKIFAVTGELYEELTRYFSKEKLVPFIPYSHIEPIELVKAEKPRIVSIGGINARKNQLELIKAYENLLDLSIELVFIGGWDPEYKTQLDAYIADKNLRNISFLGYQNRPWTFVRDQDIIILSSQLETFGLVYIEAILAGVPSIASEVFGHQTVKNYFRAKNSYPSGDVESLSEMIRKIFENYEAEKEFSIQLAKTARELYNLETAYETFRETIQQPPLPVEKSNFRGLKSLLGWNPSQEMLDYINAQKITVYHSNQTPYYQVDFFPIKENDHLEISVGDAHYIRVDLTQAEGFYPLAQMIDKTTGQELVPVHSSAIDTKAGLLFLDQSPQLVFDTSELQGHELIFYYKKRPLHELGDEIHELFSQSHALKKQLDEVTNLYQTVINSRRWIIPTKFINFFRREK